MNPNANHTWIQWCRRLGGEHLFAHERMSSADLDLLERFIQSAMENPRGFAKAFEPIWGEQILKPMGPEGAGRLANIIGNGINDDWELRLQWREEGYAVVGEHESTSADQPFRAPQALRILDLISGGKREAPGLADEAFWIQAAAEMPFDAKARTPGQAR